MFPTRVSPRMNVMNALVVFATAGCLALVSPSHNPITLHCLSMPYHPDPRFHPPLSVYQEMNQKQTNCMLVLQICDIPMLYSRNDHFPVLTACCRCCILRIPYGTVTATFLTVCGLIISITALLQSTGIADRLFAELLFRKYLW